mmetsp:Transcript_6731/g.8343  ORF Transcript_6731/g.8343 Transcript_6731/m.8343 type:complete len:81 (+) Transcript_6731:472-714(+)
MRQRALPRCMGPPLNLLQATPSSLSLISDKGGCCCCCCCSDREDDDDDDDVGELVLLLLAKLPGCEWPSSISLLRLGVLR